MIHGDVLGERAARLTALGVVAACVVGGVVYLAGRRRGAVTTEVAAELP
jgi:hypothetical protein